MLRNPSRRLGLARTLRPGPGQILGGRKAGDAVAFVVGCCICYHLGIDAPEIIFVDTMSWLGGACNRVRIRRRLEAG